MKTEVQEPTQRTPCSEQSLQSHLSDYLVYTVGADEDRLVALNEFFNSTKIKSELHWFTHRDTLQRAASRDDRCLFYFAPFDRIIGGLMVWCESRVLEPHQAQIRLVAVDPDYRQLGIGHYLVRSAIEFAQSHDKSTMIADVASEASAVSFWKACGFEKSDTYETNGGREMFRMSRRIN